MAPCDAASASGPRYLLHQSCSYMGKPFDSEISRISDTYAWAAMQAVPTLQPFVARSLGTPLVAVGSGGSFTSAVFAATLHQHAGHLAKAVTPYDLIHSGAAYRGASVLILSAGGRNRDILAALRYAAELEPVNLGVFSTTAVSKLSRLATDLGTQFEGIGLPTGKDGFLATNSLFASAVMLSNAYSAAAGSPSLPGSLPPYVAPALDETPLGGVDAWTVLYGAWGGPTAWDLESKLTEGALGSPHITDYRNFGHGRHHWFAKRRGTSGVIVVSTPEDEEIAERTCAVLPDVPTVKLAANYPGPAGSLQTLAGAMEFIAALGRARGIDPGRPGVPEFGRRLYRMSPPRTSVYDDRPRGMTKAEAAAIMRKSGAKSIGALSTSAVSYWRSAYRATLRKLKSASLGAIVFDYDGTLCPADRRFVGVAPEVSSELRRLVSLGLGVGVATGRGRSVGNDLRNALPEALWTSVLVGYYNGGEVAPLSDVSSPDRESDPDPVLARLMSELESDPWFAEIATGEVRPRQITVEPRTPSGRSILRAYLRDALGNRYAGSIKVCESGHSFDIVPEDVSKRAVVLKCASELSPDRPHVLCIGDSGAWPGNDYDLLSEPLSLSVDSVSMSASTCWNLVSPGTRRVEGTVEYLRRIGVSGETVRFT